jgi:hypothetical protein
MPPFLFRNGIMECGIGCLPMDIRRQASRCRPEGDAPEGPMKDAFFRWLAKTKFVQKAIAERADLSAFRQPPSLRILAGIFAIAFSYVIGWPAVGALGTLSVYFKQPLIVVIGGPVTYGLSHLVFLLGMYLAGADYTKIFLRWAARVAVEKHIAVKSARDSD